MHPKTSHSSGSRPPRRAGGGGYGGHDSRFRGSRTSAYSHGVRPASPASGGYSSTSRSGEGAPASKYSGSSRGGSRFGGSSHSSHGSSRGGSRFSGGRSSGGRFGGSRSGGGGRSQTIDISRFVNKAIITEEAALAGAFIPEHMFTDFVIDERLKAQVVGRGYKAPTPIQDRVIPYILRGSDVVGIANTGTGKTAAFLIPLINKVLLKPNEQVLVVVPTRELAIQIQDELRSFTKGMKLFSVCCVGGASIGRQKSELRYQNSFIIGTPGRLKDLIEQGCINLGKFNTVVLDEADRMLDMGFIADMRWMMSRMPKPRHTLFFSATLSKEIERLIGEFLHEPVTVSVKTQETSKNIDQDIIRISQGMNKIDVLQDLLAKPEFKKVLVFGRTKHGVAKLATALASRGILAESIHGDKNHSQRQRALTMFKDNKLQVLVATDVAARGLDIVGISHVINFDVPATYDDYVHRIGRTGRGASKGKALTFIG